MASVKASAAKVPFGFSGLQKPRHVQKPWISSDDRVRKASADLTASAGLPEFARLCAD